MRVIQITLILAILFALTSCGSSKKAAQKKQEEGLGQEILVPCNDDEFHTDKETFRSTGIGISLDLSTSKRKANLDASGNLAGSINKIIKRVTEQYTNEREISNKMDFSRKFEDITREIVKQEISNLSVACSKTFQKNGKYTTYMAVEVRKDEFLNKINNNISKNAKLNQDFEKKKFQEILEKEMEEFKKEN